MATTAPTTTPLPSAVEDRLPLLLVLVAASGCAALIYEVVWYQLLPLAIGSTSVSLGILLAAFMGGLCIGSVWLPRVLPQCHPLQIYAALELGIGVCAILVQFGLPFLNRIYITGAEHGLPGMLLRATLAGICLLPPTILMGASFLSLGAFLSSTTKNQIVAATLTFGCFLMLWVMEWVSYISFGPVGTALSYLSITSHFESFAKGVIELKDVVYYLSMISLGLFLTARSLAITKSHQVTSVRP